MERLIELLNEYDKWEWKINSEWKLDYSDMPEYVTQNYFELMICSKVYGFIQRLVDNDKISDKMKNKTVVKEVYQTNENELWISADFYSIYESLLMLLSIQDEPIEFLVSILK